MNAGIEIILYRPDFAEPERRRLEIPLDAYRDALAPLPRAREIMQLDAEQAMIQQVERERLALTIARKFASMLAPAILGLMETRDTHRGYEPEQLLDMTEAGLALETAVVLTPQKPFCPRCGRPA